jgi:hypothetical protein
MDKPLKYKFRIVKGSNGAESSAIDVESPHEVLFDLSGIPASAYPKIIAQIYRVIAGEEELSEFGWHRAYCYAGIENTTVYDLHAEDMGTTPWFQIPTEEILKLLEDYYSFYLS